MDTLGDDLLLLLIRSKDGKVAKAERIDFGLMGSELIRLAAAGRVGIDEGRVVVSDSSPTGDAELDQALRSLQGGRQPVKPERWVAKPRRRIRSAYLDRLQASGAIRGLPGTGLLRPQPRWEIADSQRLTQVRARLDRIAQGGGQLGTEQAAFGGLAYAVGLDRHLYPGWAGRAERKRLSEVAQGQWTMRSVGAAAGSGRDPGPVGETAAVHAAARAIHAAVHAATHAAVHAAHQAAGHAASGHGSTAGH
jgi:hypothetical protein